MHRLLRNAFLAAGLTALVLPSGLDAQLREIVAKSVAASSSGASLELEFADEGDFELGFRGGVVYVDDEAVGSYEPGGVLETALRSLLADAMTLENGALAETLVEWRAPADVDGDDAEVARAVDDALEEALEVVGTDAAAARNGESASAAAERSLEAIILESVPHLTVLGEALEGVDAIHRVYVDEDVVVDEGSVVEGNLVVIGGTLRVAGEVAGDVVVVDGSLEVLESGVIRGEARIADARIRLNRGEIDGGIVDVLEEEREMERNLRDELREEIRAEVSRDLRRERHYATSVEDGDGFSIMSPIRPVIRGVGGVLEKLMMVFILGLVGAGFLAFAGENMEAIAATARRSPGRSAMVGLAGGFLLIPVWVLGLVALVVSIIGIPVAVAWAPLFPLAAALAALLGYLAVAQIAGEWLADSQFPWTGWIRKSNPVFTLVGGLIGLLFAFMLGHVISILPILGFLSGLLFAVGVIVTVGAILTGFGAVLLTRGGRRPEYHEAYDPDAAWEAAISVDVDDDDLGRSAGGPSETGV